METHRWAISVAAIALLTGAACVDRLPEQDRRITVATAVAKLTAEDLWKDFQEDAAAARTKYWGKAIEVSGKPTRTDADDRPSAYVFFAQAEPFGIRANLLDDQAAAIIAEVEAGGRIRLKCFCEGLDGNVLLKSCIKAE
jgi:hypothetical protein